MLEEYIRIFSDFLKNQKTRENANDLRCVLGRLTKLLSHDIIVFDLKTIETINTHFI